MVLTGETKALNSLTDFDGEVGDLLQESLIAFGPDGRITSWNRASERIYGWSRDEAEGRLFTDVFGASALPDAEAPRDQQSSRPCVRTVTRKTNYGRDVIVVTRVLSRTSKDKGTIDFIEAGVDITSQERIETAAGIERSHYRNVFQAVPASIWDIDFSYARAMALTWLASTSLDPRSWFAANPDRVRELMRMTYARDVNEQAVQLFGPCERENLLVSVERYWPDDSTGDFADWVVASLAGETLFSRVTRQRRYDGREFDALFTANYSHDTVAEGRLVVSIVDYSDAKRGQAAVRESDAFYRDLFGGSAVAAFHLDATRTWAIYHDLYRRGIRDFRAHLRDNPTFIDEVMDGIRVVDVNDQSVKLFEAEDRSKLIGGSIAPLWFPDTRRETLLQSLEGAFNGIPKYRGLGRMRTLAGNEIHVLFTRSASIALSSTGQVLLAIVDMTDKVYAQNALAEMQVNLARADRISSLGQLTASIAHEVNQPLAAITSNGEASIRWLGRSPPDLMKVSSSVEDMISDAGRAIEIVTNIRSMALPQTVAHQIVSLNSLVENAVELLSDQFRKADLSAQCDLQPDLPEVLGNPIQLQQVIVNLVLNALQAMHGRPLSSLRIKTVAVTGTTTLIVHDNGPGIRTDSFDRLFNSFYTTKTDGMGIGLAICQTLIEAHGGTIRAANWPDGGAVFTVALPSL